MFVFAVALSRLTELLFVVTKVSSVAKSVQSELKLAYGQDKNEACVYVCTMNYCQQMSMYTCMTVSYTHLDVYKRQTFANLFDKVSYLSVVLLSLIHI